MNMGAKIIWGVAGVSAFLLAGYLATWALALVFQFLAFIGGA